MIEAGEAHVLEVEDLFKQYPGVAGTVAGGVFGVDLRLREGELFTLLGPSGCGKTTTLRAIAGLEKPQRGRITLGGRSLFDVDRHINVPMYDRDIGMVFQSYAIWPHMTVFENAAYPLQVGKTPKFPRRELRKRVMDVLALVGLEDYAARPAPLLSGGQQQRLALARALTRAPLLLLLDEPLSNLDAQLREQMRVELKRLQKETAVTAIYVTHDQSEALAISDRIAVMKDGVIVQIGTPREIYERPVSEFVANFIGRTNLLHGGLGHDVAEGAEARIDTSLGPVVCTFQAAADRSPRIGIVVRPENITIAKAGSVEAAKLPDVNRFDGQIVGESYLGETVEFLVEVRGHTILVRTRSDAPLAPGDRAVLAFPATHALALVERAATSRAVAAE